MHQVAENEHIAALVERLLGQVDGALDAKAEPDFFRHNDRAFGLRSKFTSPPASLPFHLVRYSSAGHITVGPKPFHRARQRVLDRRLRQSQLPYRFGRVEKHFVPRHLHAFERMRGRATQNAI